MEQNGIVPAWYKNTEEQQLANYIINLEKSALDRFLHGDMSGYRDLWSKHSFTYYDALTLKRVEKFSEMEDFLNELEGNLDSSECRFVSPRVQFGKDMVVLTFQLFAKVNTSIKSIEYNVVEVFQKEDNGEWHVIHSTWSFIRPIDKDFSKMKEQV